MSSTHGVLARPDMTAPIAREQGPGSVGGWGGGRSLLNPESSVFVPPPTLLTGQATVRRRRGRRGRNKRLTKIMQDTIAEEEDDGAEEALGSTAHYSLDGGVSLVEGSTAYRGPDVDFARPRTQAGMGDDESLGGGARIDGGGYAARADHVGSDERRAGRSFDQLTFDLLNQTLSRLDVQDTEAI